MMNNNVISEKRWMYIIALLSVIIISAVALLVLKGQNINSFNPGIYILPKINAFLNGSATIFLILGYFQIRKKNIPAHRLSMFIALGFSSLFLVFYLFYHYNAPHTSFGGEGLIRNIYFLVLITHIILATFIVPMALLTLFRIWKWQVEKHRKIAKITLPVWLYVSISGVIVYLMIAPYYPV
jgi:putative membrane protein